MFVSHVGVGVGAVLVVAAGFQAAAGVGDIAGTGDAAALRSGVGINLATSAGAVKVSVFLVSSAMGMPLQSILVSVWVWNE